VQWVGVGGVGVGRAHDSSGAPSSTAARYTAAVPAPKPVSALLTSPVAPIPARIPPCPDCKQGAWCIMFRPGGAVSSKKTRTGEGRRAWANGRTFRATVPTTLIQTAALAIVAAGCPVMSVGHIHTGSAAADDVSSKEAGLTMGAAEGSALPHARRVPTPQPQLQLYSCTVLESFASQ
jgi:hypothetical protein